MIACVSVSALAQRGTRQHPYHHDISTVLTDLFLALEHIQPPILCRFPCLWRFMVFEHDTRHIRRPGFRCLVRGHADRVAFGCQETRVCKVGFGRGFGSLWWLLQERLEIVVFRVVRTHTPVPVASLIISPPITIPFPASIVLCIPAIP
jgi:hypothetical protein